MEFYDRARTAFSRIPPLAADSALAMTLAALELYNFYVQRALGMCPCYPSSGFAIAVLLGSTLPLVLRRRYPFGSGFVVGVSLVLAGANDAGELGVGGLVSIYTVASLSPPLKRKLALAFVIAAIFTNPFIDGDFESIPEDVVTLGGAWALGVLVRTRRAYTEQLEERAARLERERLTLAQLAVAQERARIARELHDVVAHSMGVMVVQAQGAKSVLKDDPTAADEALTRIEAVGRDALGDMRKLLGVLRTSEESAALIPQPGLSGLGSLIDTFESAGLSVEVETSGSPGPLSPGADLSAYRIVQESLTNVMKHAGVDRALLAMTWEPGWLTIEVRDEGRGAGSSNGGHGIVGMKERVSMLGGTLSTRSDNGNGFVVTARVPVEEPK
ncbi:MAG: sensor histidine kinase [Actinomycetota bacterium]